MSISSSVNQSCRHIEQVFNLLECIPIVGIVSSITRAHLGAMQATAGIVTIIAGGIGLFSTSFLTNNPQTKEMFERVVRFGQDHTLHGALNYLRGQSVAFAGLMTGGMGNVVMVIPNLMNGFEPVFAYRQNTMQSAYRYSI
ncbi:MAG: hypothetical protein ACSNEK_08265 [Parachlamydiaceae bacterium]